MPAKVVTDRRRFLAVCSSLGLTSSLFPGVVLGMAAPKEETLEITREMITRAARIADVPIAETDQELMFEGLRRQLKGYEEIHKLQIPNHVAPALVFDPVLPGMKFNRTRKPPRMSETDPVEAPRNLEDAAFYSVRQLAELVRSRKVSSLALTEMYLERLKRYDPLLKCVITFAEKRARAQAKEADRDLARGKYRGPLHGLPWGAKDLLAVKGYPTTWGAAGFEDQKLDEDAAVVQRLDKAGAVLMAKLSLGALAQGDVWFGGMTRNPWKLDQGSSGSSAGSASATAAGCVAFAIGSETLGSISSPCTRCGTTGLRPTFGRVPRTGAMALSWSMDKLGPICRSVEDCALVLGAIYGPDGRDRSVRNLPFNWDASLHPRTLRVGYFKEDFEKQGQDQPDEKPEDKVRRLAQKRFDADALQVLRKVAGKLIPLKLPELPYVAMRPLLTAEAAAAFDELTRNGGDRKLTAQKENDWPNIFRIAHLYPAVEYVNANRARMMAMEGMAEIFKQVDVIVAPTFSPQLLVTNLSGHPAVILPDGFRDDGTPASLTFVGNLYAEDKVLATARAYQQATEWHLRRPKLDGVVG